MPLDDLLETIETIQGRIRDHRTLLGQNEIRTRYALIDPLLRALGWDTGDPDEVAPEQDASGGRVDYALLKGGHPEVMVEAKKLGTDLTGAVTQGVTYCLEKGARHFAVTDGQRWSIYDTQKPGPLHERVVTEFDLGGSAAEASLKALALWRSGVAEGKVRAGVASVLGEEPSVVEPPPRRSQQKEATPRPSGTKRPDVPVPPDHPTGDWLGLDRLTTSKGKGAPPALQFPDRSSVDIGRWTHIPERILEWLLDTNRLRVDQAPITSGNRHIISTSPIHPTGREFFNRKQVGPLWLESNYDPTGQVRNALLIIEHAGLDPADFKVRLAD